MKPSTESGAMSPRLWVAIVALGVLGLAAGWVSHFRKALPTGSSQAFAERSLTNLVLESGRWRLMGSTNLFTGVAVEYYRDGTLRSRSRVFNGRLQGLSEGWYTNGQVQVTEHFKEGLSEGLRTKWYPSGAKESEALIVGGQLSGTFRRWHENGTLAEQVEFVAGQPTGTSVSYFPSGCLKARVVLKDAKPVQQEFWKDGENKG